ncbi:hypothetical protein K438DRAFT_1779613 [Mycena galopus ATCC 62051]|nr:hypothetical protein K438DRAFT_1779613 [Mycena galopus ATCC 62051]
MKNLGKSPEVECERYEAVAFRHSGRRLTEFAVLRTVHTIGLQIRYYLRFGNSLTFAEIPRLEGFCGKQAPNVTPLFPPAVILLLSALSLRDTMPFGPRVNINDPRTFRCPKCTYLVDLQILAGSDPIQCFLGLIPPGSAFAAPTREPGIILNPASSLILCRPCLRIKYLAQSRLPQKSLFLRLVERDAWSAAAPNQETLTAAMNGADNAVSRPLSPEFLARLSAIAADMRAPVDQTILQANLSLLHDRQRDAAFTASLPSLPPSPTKSQDDRHREYTVRLARGVSTPRPSPPQPAASSSRSLLPAPARRIILIYWAHTGQQAAISVVQDCAAWERTWPGIKLDDFVQHLSSSDTMYEFYSAEYRTWISIPPVYVQIVRTDQPFLVRRVGVLDGVNHDGYIQRLHTFLDLPLLPPTPLRTRPASATTRRRPRPLKLIEIEEDDNEVEIVEFPRRRAKVKIEDVDDDEVQVVGPPCKRAKVVKIDDDDDNEVELVESSSRCRWLSASPTPSLSLSVKTSDSTASIRSLSPSPEFPTILYPRK